MFRKSNKSNSLNKKFEHKENKFNEENKRWNEILLSLKNKKSFKYKDDMKHTMGYHWQTTGKLKREKISISSKGISLKNAKYLTDIALQGCYITPLKNENDSYHTEITTANFLEISNQQHTIEDNIKALININNGHNQGTNLVEQKTNSDIANTLTEYIPTAKEIAMSLKHQSYHELISNSSTIFNESDRSENEDLIKNQIENIERNEEENTCVIQ